MKRSPIARHHQIPRPDPDKVRDWQRRSRKPLPARSQRREEQRDERAEMVREMLAKYPACAAQIPWMCKHWSSEVNELKRGGQRATEYLIKGHCETLCHNCHAWITVHPDWARRHGHQVTGEADEAEFLVAVQVRVRSVARCDVDCEVDHREEFQHE